MYCIIKEGRRRRYIGFIIKNKSVGKITKFDIIDEIKNQCILTFNKNIKNMGIRVIKFNGDFGIIRCNYLEKDNIIKLLNSINKINNNKIKIKTIATSGTIKSLENKHMLNYQSVIII